MRIYEELCRWCFISAEMRPADTNQDTKCHKRFKLSITCSGQPFGQTEFNLNSEGASFVDQLQSSLRNALAAFEKEIVSLLCTLDVPWTHTHTHTKLRHLSCTSCFGLFEHKVRRYIDNNGNTCTKDTPSECSLTQLIQIECAPLFTFNCTAGEEVYTDDDINKHQSGSPQTAQ